MSNTEGFLEEEAFELAFRGDMESREERLFDRIGCGRRRHKPPWGGGSLERTGGRGMGGVGKASCRVQGRLARFRRKSQERRSSESRDCRGKKLGVTLNFLSDPCLSWRAPSGLAEAAWGSGRILLCFRNYPVTHQKIILSWEEGRFGVLETATAEVRAA